MEFLEAFTNMDASADQFFCPFVVVGKQKIFRMTKIQNDTYFGTMMVNGFLHLLLRIEREK